LSHLASLCFSQQSERDVLFKNSRLVADFRFSVFSVKAFDTPRITKKGKSHQNSLIWPNFGRFCI
jgi:hypothetical protein